MLISGYLGGRVNSRAGDEGWFYSWTLVCQRREKGKGRETERLTQVEENGARTQVGTVS